MILELGVDIMNLIGVEKKNLNTDWMKDKYAFVI